MRCDRERLGLTVAQAAGRIGLKPAHLRRSEDGEVIDEYEVWDKLATFYGWSRSRT
jgi:ribosome-binding protein aMBF1 (putative translation factor)